MDINIDTGRLFTETGQDPTGLNNNTQDNGTNFGLGNGGENPNPNSLPDGCLLGHNTHQNDESNFSANTQDRFQDNVATGQQTYQDNVATGQQTYQDNMAAGEHTYQDNIPEAQDRTPT
jgi:hypothetical protein